MYIITGATGNTGRAIAIRLLEAGKRVRVVVRNAEKAKDLVDKGAELAVADLNDPQALAAAFQGGNAVYALIPPSMQVANFTEYQKEIADAIVWAVKASSVPNVVMLSSVGAHMEKGSGLILGLKYMEDSLRKLSDVNVLALRPTYFMENTLGMAAMVKHMGIMGSPIKKDLRFHMIATKDIADYASKRLLNLDFIGFSHQYLLGPRDISYNDVTAVYGKSIGKEDLTYVEIPYQDFHNTMTQQWGVSPHVATMFQEFMTAANEGKIMEDAVRNSESTTPTSIEDFVPAFAAAFNQA